MKIDLPDNPYKYVIFLGIILGLIGSRVFITKTEFDLYFISFLILGAIFILVGYSGLKSEHDTKVEGEELENKKKQIEIIKINQEISNLKKENEFLQKRCDEKEAITEKIIAEKNRKILEPFEPLFKRAIEEKIKKK